MFQLDDFLDYSPDKDKPKDLSVHTRDTDKGYCSSISNLSSPSHEFLSQESDLQHPFSMFNLPCIEDSMHFEDSADIFSAFEKQELGVFQNGTHDSQHDLTNQRRKSLCTERAKLLQSENSAFSVNSSRFSKLNGSYEKANDIDTQTSVWLNGDIHNSMTSQSSVHPSMQNNDVHCLRNNSNTFGNYSLTSNSFICNNTSAGKRLPASESLLRRQLSDSSVQNYSGNGNNFEVNNSLEDIAEASDYPSQYLNTPQRHERKLEYDNSEVKHHIGDLGLVDASMSTLSPSSTTSGKPDLPQDDCIQRFFHSSQDTFPPSPNDPVGCVSNLAICGSTSDLRDHLSNRVGDSETLSNHNSIGTGLSGPGGGRTPTEAEAWRSYLENPITAATTAMISINGDQDSAAALSLLYEHYKVPREKRLVSCQPEQPHASNRRQSAQSPDAPINEQLSDEPTIISSLSAGGSARSFSNTIINQESVSDIGNRLPMLGNDVTTLTSVRPDIGLHVEPPPSEYVSIDRPHGGEKMTRNQLTPDSAFSESKDSPPHVNQNLSFGDYSGKYTYSSTTRHGKRKRSISSVRISAGEHENNWLHQSTIPQQLVSTQPTACTTNVELLSNENYGDLFEYTMEAPKSLKQKEGEPTMSYINKARKIGTFYVDSTSEDGKKISFASCDSSVSALGASDDQSNNLMFVMKQSQSVVQIVFGDAKPEEEQLRHWKYWHARQHTAKQRIIDIADYKESCMISDIDEFAHNAIRFSWDTNDIAKIYVSCNCLSTDFSAQKGIKGLPLLIQIDTYLDNRKAEPPDHRGVCQLKVFCDKGAERKIRDEERKALKKKQKSVPKGASMTQQNVCLSPVDIKPIIRSPNTTPPLQSVTSAPGLNVSPQKRQDNVRFKTVHDCSIPTVHFFPEVFAHSSMARNHVAVSSGSRVPSESSFLGGMLTPTSGGELEQVFLTSQAECFDPLRAPKRTQSIVSSEEGDFPANKIPRQWEQESDKRVLLYIRKESDDVYDGVMLREPTLEGLKEALQEKYNISAEKITKVLKKSKKGILVNVDDNIVRHYSNEDTFVIDITKEVSDDDVIYKVTLCTV